MIKVLIVEDSAFMRKLLTDLFAADSEFMVVDTARNGKDALDKVKRLKPDLITMDVEMPVMDGIAALKVIMCAHPTPVVMVSSLTHSGAEATIQALAWGAVDFVTKSGGAISNINEISDEILAKCRMAARVDVTHLAPQTSALVSSTQMAATGLPQHSTDSLAHNSIGEQIVAIGTSTGGPRALQEIISKLPGNLPGGVVIVQHMPPGFTRSLSERLNSLSSLTVKEAEHNDVIQPGLVLVAPGDYHMLLESEGGKKVVKLNQDPPVGGHRPAVDPMLESAAELYGRNTIGVILTGMGYDGAKGIQFIKQREGYTIAEDQSTAVVFGMPKSAIELGVVDKVVPLQNIACEIIKAVSK